MPLGGASEEICVAGSNVGSRRDRSFDRSQGEEATAYPALNDEQLMVRICRRDAAAFEVLFDRYCNLAYSVSMHIMRDGALSEDVVQEVFLRLWRRPDRFQSERGRFLPWLLSVVRHRAIDERRSQGRRLAHEDGTPDRETILPERASGDPAVVALVSEARAAVRRALAGLPDEQRRAIELAYFGGLTQREIADLLRQPLGTVKTRIRLGMMKLRVSLGEARRED